MAFTWDRERRKYLDDDGNVVSESQIKAWIDDTLSLIAALFLSLLADLRANKLSFEEFFRDVESNITSLHYAMTAIAFGGFTEMSTEDEHRVEFFIIDQLGYFRMLATQVFNETISDAATGARLAMYAMAGYSSYENARRQRELRAGYVVEKRILKQGNNCEECIEYALRGWQLIGTLPGIAQQCSCRSNCRCHFIFSDDATLLGK